MITGEGVKKFLNLDSVFDELVLETEKGPALLDKGVTGNLWM